MKTLSTKIQEQNKHIQEIIEEEKNNQEEISRQIDEEMSKLIQNIKNLNNINPQKLNNPIIFGLSQKISEFNMKIAKNTEKIRKNKEEIPEILRKKKESDDFFNKFMGEKKVWLDRLSEKKMQKISFEKGFKYFYEAKTIKLLLEGILLEKAEDEIEHELSLKGGDATGWEVMNIEKYEKVRKEKEFKNNLELAKISNDLEAINKEKEFKEQMELEENNIKKKRNECKKIWQEIWGEIWIPSIAYNGEQDLVTKRKFVQNVISEIIFKLFKTKLFDVWKFKNILNNTDQYIILEKIKKYLNEANDSNDFNINKINIINSRKDEDAFQKLTSIIENIRREEEIIYCDLTPAKKKLELIQKSQGNNNNEIFKKITYLVEKIEEFQKRAEKKETLLKREVEEINSLIKELPDDNDKKLFTENIKDDSRLYDVFLPLTTLLMIVVYLTVGKKRSINYEKKLEEINEENEKLELEIEEIKGKLNTLDEFNEQVKEEDEKGKEEEIGNFSQNKNSLDQLTQLFMEHKEDIFKQNNQLFDNIQNTLVKP